MSDSNAVSEMNAVVAYYNTHTSRRKQPSRNFISPDSI